MNQIILQGITVQELVEALNLSKQAKPEGHPEPQSEFITREETCKLLSINKTSLWKHTKSGKLLAHGIGNRVLYLRSQVIEAVKPLNK